MRQFLPNYYSYTASDGTLFNAQRIWSNKAAAVGTTSPCIPLPDVPMPFFSETAGTASYVATAGSTVTVDVEPWSTGPTPDWTPYTWNEGSVSGTVSQNFTTLQNDQQGAQLTVTVPSSAGTGTYVVVIIQQPFPTQGDTLYCADHHGRARIDQ